MAGIPTPGSFNMQPEAYRYIQEQERQLAAAKASAAAIAARQESYDVTIAYPADGDYPIEISAPYGYTITRIDSKSTSGTCTATYKIGAVALGGGANAVSSTLQTKTHTTANTVAVGNATTLTISANAACVNLRLTVWITRT